MRSSLSVAVLALLQGTNAFMRHTQAQLDMWAIMGLKPGEALEGSSFDNSANPRVSKRASSSVAADLQPKVQAPEHIKLPLDHFSSSKDQKYFNNRYWVNMDEYKPGGPVFIYDPGEEAADSVAKYTLYNETSFFVDILKDFHGIGIVFEHRFYGESTPVPININTTAESFRFLTAEQALKDVVVFANQFSRPDINETLTADQRPWVWVGGSYAAFRGAQMRRLYPDTIFASYSSSAPVEAVYDMDFFWDPIWEGMNAQGYGNCSRDIQAATRHIDDILDKGEPYAQQIKEKFFGLGVNSTNANFGSALALAFSQWRSWGIDGGNWGLMLICEWIEKDHKTNETAPAEGWAATRGAEYVVEQWSSYPRLVRSLNQQWEIDCSGSLNKTGDCWLDAPFTDPSVIAWTWQWCTEFGWLAPANLGPQQLLSKYMTLEYQQEWCSITFPNAPADLLPKAAPVDRTNARWGGFGIRPSNTFFTNGQWDPWRTVSLASDRSFAPKGVELTQEIPKCGVSTGKDKVFGTLMPDATHCWDFHTVENLSVEGPSTRALFKAALREWLPCFQPKNGTAKQ